MPRAADLGIRIGSLPPGPTDSVLDVPGVGLGHATVWRDEPPPPEGRGVARTGVTALLLAEDAYLAPGPGGWRRAQRRGGVHRVPHRERVGGRRDAGLPHLDDAARPGLRRGLPDRCRRASRRSARTSSIPVVAECDDSFLNDARRDAGRARRRARRVASRALARVGQVIPPQTGSVGAGTGMSCLGFKGGIGTASRVVGSGHTVGVLLLTNFGQRDRLTVDGVPVGRLLPPDPYEPAPAPAGSCIGVVVTDAPLDGAACARLARRVGLGLARVGSTAHHGSGEIFLCCASGIRADRDGGSARAAPDYRAGAGPVLRGRRRRGGGVGARLAARLAHGGGKGRPHP